VKSENWQPYNVPLVLAVIGVLAALLVLFAYYGLETGRFKADDPRYYLMNAISSVFLIISICSQFDLADSGAILMESCWLLISLKGFLKHWRTHAKPG
jgi:predicted membrane channel-forming protein YqfA (hemolysin III family)